MLIVIKKAGGECDKKNSRFFQFFIGLVIFIGIVEWASTWRSIIVETIVFDIWG